MDCVEGGVDHQNAGEQNQWQHHQEGDGRFSLERVVQAGTLAGVLGTSKATLLECDIDHGALGGSFIAQPALYRTIGSETEA
jgi:hypothetical protein